MPRTPVPTPLFDEVDTLKTRQPAAYLTATQNKDLLQADQFLLCYQNNKATFTAYRREVERLLQWCFLKENKTLKQLKRDDIDSYIKFCMKPLKSWIGVKKVARFKLQSGARRANPDWRPFVASLSKAEVSQGKTPNSDDYSLSQKSLQDIFTVTSSFFNFLIQEDYVGVNPVQKVRQKNKYFQKYQTKKVVRKLSELQWGYVIETAYMMANEDSKYERTLFIMNILYSLYLRISELVASERWTPTMGGFARDPDGLWWFTTVGKGNKERQIAVSPSMMKALKRWRKHLGLPMTPTIGEAIPLIPKHLGDGPITSDRPIRKLVQECFDNTVERLIKDGLPDEAEPLKQATVHWLRHTGISDDVKIRPREHVRDDAGHSSSNITDKYIDVELRDRYNTAKKKQIIPESFEEEMEGL